MVLVTQDYSALFIWRKFINDSGQQGINCAVFRNESPILSSELILEAELLACRVGPGKDFIPMSMPERSRAPIQVIVF